MRTLRLILLTAVAYYVTGRLSLLLAIPPGYATAVWPPAGIALSAVLLGGYRVWPGILLGSFLVNVGTSFDGSSTAALLRSLTVPGAIGAGAALQALVAGVLIRRFVPNPERILDLGLGVIRLLLLGAPLGCVVSATIGVTSLWAAGLIPGASYPFSWWTWWVGDSIGVLIATPLVLVWGLPADRHRRRQQLVTTLPMAIMFVFVVVLFMFISDRESARIRAEFEKSADLFVRQLQQHLLINLNTLSAIRGLYESSNEVTPEEFERFADRLYRHELKVQALAWNAYVRDEDRAAFESHARKTVFPDYYIFELTPGKRRIPAARRPDYFPVFESAPRQFNQRTIGFDVGSEAIRRKAIATALQTGEATATGPIHLVQFAEDDLGILLIEPTYRYGRPSLGLTGLAVVVVRFKTLMDSVFEYIADTGIQVRVYDQTGDMPDELLYAAPALSDDRDIRNDLLYSVRLEVQGRSWRVDFTVPAGYLVAHRSWQAWSILAAGLFLAALLGILILVTVGYTAHIEAEVTERTAELNRVNAELQKEISERARLQHEADQRAEQLADKNLELERFAYVVSHDLQAPLRSITGFTELLGQRYREQFDAEGREFLQYIIDGATQMRCMIADILALSRIGSGELQRKPVDVAAVVEQVRAALRIDLQDAQAQLECGPLPVVPADESQLLQLFQNLIGNAIKFRLPQRPPVIRISATRTDQGWHFQVADNGIGIPKDKQGRLFNLFVRLHTAEEYPGTGLGLAICKRVIERHGGRIWLESEPGQGTVFHFILPS